jgi:hypothetical protein
MIFRSSLILSLPKNLKAICANVSYRSLSLPKP